MRTGATTAIAEFAPHACLVQQLMYMIAMTSGAEVPRYVLTRNNVKGSRQVVYSHKYSTDPAVIYAYPEGGDHHQEDQGGLCCHKQPCRPEEGGTRWRGCVCILIGCNSCTHTCTHAYKHTCARMSNRTCTRTHRTLQKHGVLSTCRLAYARAFVLSCRHTHVLSNRNVRFKHRGHSPSADRRRCDVMILGNRCGSGCPEE